MSTTSRQPEAVAGTTTRARLFSATRSTIAAGLRSVAPVLSWVSLAAWLSLAIGVLAVGVGFWFGWVPYLSQRSLSTYRYEYHF